MNNLFDSLWRGPLMTMTLECENEFPRVLKDLMSIMGFEGPAVYWGFPFIDEEDNLEYWWVQKIGRAHV